MRSRVVVCGRLRSARAPFLIRISKNTGPWLPKNFIHTNATLADRINPFDRDETSPVLAAAVFNTAFLSDFDTNLQALVTANPGAPDILKNATAVEQARLGE